MKKFFLGLVLITGHYGLLAQHIQLVEDSLVFNTTNEKVASTLTARVYNSGPYIVEVVDVDGFKIYGDYPFTVSDTAFTLAPGDTQQLAISFLPEHNIMHQMGMVIKTISGFGHEVIRFTAQGTYTNPYYSSTENKSGQQLKSALNSRLGQGYNSLGYNSARDQMYGSIDNVGGTVSCVYTGRTASFSTRSGANSNNFNCEHTFPQGMFNSNEPMKSDIHHLYPTDVSANSQRGNDPFGMVSNASWSQGGSKSGGGKFEPRDVQKGATARSMMYFVLRYQDYNNFFQAQENILRQWHEQYPPAADERTRNNSIYAVQGNRNPFVDYPQLAERIPSLVSNKNPDDIIDLYSSDDTIKLAAANGQFTFTYALYNAGNTTVNLSNFSLSDSNLSFASPLASTIALQPHESLEVPIIFDGGNSYNATLDFNTNIAGQVNTSVPVVSGSAPQVGLADRGVQAGVTFYPNPTSDFVEIKSASKITAVSIINLSGQVFPFKVGSSGKINVSNLPEGLYIIQISNEQGVGSYRLLIQ